MRFARPALVVLATLAALPALAEDVAYEVVNASSATLTEFYTSPASSGLGWSIPKLRRSGGARAGGFPGADRILAEMAEGAKATRRGLRPAGRAPIREGVPLHDAETGGSHIGTVASGGFGPTVGAPIATAILPATLPEGATVWAEVRGKRLPAEIVPLPFYKPSYKR